MKWQPIVSLVLTVVLLMLLVGVGMYHFSNAQTKSLGQFLESFSDLLAAPVGLVSGLFLGYYFWYKTVSVPRTAVGLIRPGGARFGKWEGGE